MAHGSYFFSLLHLFESGSVFISVYPPAAKVRAGRLKMTTSTFTIINRGDWSKEKRQDFCCKVHDRAQSFRFGFIHYP